MPDIIPSWWGIIRAKQKGKNVVLETIRDYKDNPQRDPYSLAQLLWQNEGLTILQQYNLAKGLKNKPRRYVWAALAENIPVKELSKIIRETLKKRESLKMRDNWKVVSQQK